jgi:hypothetical protein
MEMLLFRISGLLQNWMILCPVDKKPLLMDCIDKIKMAAGTILWLPYVNQLTTCSFRRRSGGDKLVNKGNAADMKTGEVSWWRLLNIALE